MLTLADSPTHAASPTLAQALILVSIWKPLFLLVVLAGWAWVVSAVYDKHAARFFLPRRRWNLIHLAAGTAAFLGALLVGTALRGEGAFWAGFGVMLVILVADLIAYAVSANKDERVPERFKINLNILKNLRASEEDKKAKQQAKVALAIRTADAKGKFVNTLAAPLIDTPEYEVRTAAEQAYIAGAIQRAQQIDIGPAGKDNLYGVTYTVDGVRQPGETMPAANAGKMMDFWKAAAGLDVADRRKKQTGQIQIEHGVSKQLVRVSSTGVQGGGMRVTLLPDPEGQVNKKFTELGLLESQQKELQALVAEGKGVVLLTAPLDHGRTTTLYAVLKMHDAYTSNVQTAEIEAQAAIEGTRSNVFNPAADPAGTGAGGEFSTLVRSILRRDPDVLGVAELPDANTAKEIAKSDLERIRVYLSFRAGDSLTAVQTYVKSVGDGRAAGNSLHGVLCQRLVRKLCTNCRVPYPPTPDMLKKLGIPEGKVQQLFKKGGQVLIKNKPEVCPVCHGSGYHGQDGVFEIFPLGPEERELIVAGNFNGLKAAFRKRQLPTIQQVAIRKAVDGITSVEEVMRVTASERPAEGGSGGAAAPTAPAPAGA